jgi:hypothetical protein
MLFNNLDIGGAVQRPDKADTLLPVHPHGMLPSSITFQFFQVESLNPQYSYRNDLLTVDLQRKRAIPPVNKLVSVQATQFLNTA